MHEMGMMYQLAEIATNFADENDIDEIKQVNVEVGELAGVFPEIFTDFFPYVAEQYPKLRHAKLKLRPAPGEGLCENCHSIYNVMKYEGECPRCHSHVKKILGGRDVKLLSLGY